MQKVAMCGYCGFDADARCTVEGCNAETCRRHRDADGVCVGAHTSPAVAEPAVAEPAEITLTSTAEGGELDEAAPKPRRRSRRKKTNV